MSHKKLETLTFDGFVFFKKPFTKKWVISGVDICRFLGYENPYLQAKKIYSRYKENFTETSHILVLPRSKKFTKGGTRTGYPPESSNRQEIRCYTRPGCWFFLAKCHTKKANAIIERLFKAFDNVLVHNENRKTLAWNEARENGKIGRRAMTDAVKTFIEYAKSQGSKNADKYYTIFTKATYGVIGHRGAVPKNFRDNMSSYDLAVVSLLEIATDKELYDLMERGIPYKECFLEVKKIMVKRSQSIVQNISPLSAIS